MGNMPEVVIEDPWQARMDRMRRVMPMPLLLLSTVAALVVTGRQHTWARFELGLPVVAAAAAWWAVVTARVRPDASTGWRLTVFAVHTALAASLVWVSLPYGVFAYVGFLLAYGLGARWRTLGFVATALVVSAAMAGGYPSGNVGQTVTYLIVAGVLVALVMNSASITNRVMEQNQERGRMIGEMAKANRRLEASMAANAELHTQLVTRAREAGVVEERPRFAGEIHDTLAQALPGSSPSSKRPSTPGITRIHGPATSPRPGLWPEPTSPRPGARCARFVPSSLRRPACPRRSARWRAPGRRGR